MEHPSGDLNMIKLLMAAAGEGELIGGAAESAVMLLIGAFVLSGFLALTQLIRKR